MTPRPAVGRDRVGRIAGVLALVVGAAWSVGAVQAPSAAAQGCGPAPAGQVAVAVVVDDERQVSNRCVVVPDRTDGYQVLRAAGHQLRIESGFLCAIDGFPATGCANRPGFDGSYWRYFHASPGGSWAYSNVGGGGYRMPDRCAVEGWRWASAGSTNTPPSIAPPQVRCDLPTPTTSPPPVTAAPVAPPATQAPGGPGVLPSGGPPSDPSDGAAPPSGDEGGAAPSEQPGPSDPADPAAEGVGEAAVEGATDGRSDEQSEDSRGDDPDGADADGAGAGGDRGSDERALDASSSEGAGSPVGVVLAAVLVALLGGSAWWRARRRNAAVAGESAEGP